MQVAQFDSTVLVEARFDDAGNTLEIELRSGRAYRYFLVPRSAFEALASAESAGSYFNREIRPRYPCERLR